MLIIECELVLFERYLLDKFILFLPTFQKGSEAKSHKRHEEEEKRRETAGE